MVVGTGMVDVGGAVVGETGVVVDVLGGTVVVVELLGGGAAVVVVVGGGGAASEPEGELGDTTNAGSEGVAARYPKSPTSPITAPLSIKAGLFIVASLGPQDRRGGGP